jgi:hypothetical protein
MDNLDEVQDLLEEGGMKRREFLRKVLAAAVGLPAATALIAGCDGDGILEPPGGGPGPAPQGNLGEEVLQMRQLITQIIDAIAALTGADGDELAAWLAQLNAQLADVWPLMVAANQQGLRDNVSPEMQPVLDQLDDFNVPLDYSGPVPQITQQRLQDAWNRAEDLLLPQAAGDGPYATEQTWGFFLILFLMFPAIAGTDAFNFATAAGTMDTENQAGQMYDMLHPTGEVSCTPCFFNSLISTLLAILMLVFMAAGSEMGEAPSMLFGRDFPILLVLLAVVLMLFLVA